MSTTRLHKKYNTPIAPYGTWEDAEAIEDDIMRNEGHAAMRAGIRTRFSPDGSNPRMEWYSDLGHGVDVYSTLYRQLEGIAEKYIGKSYDDAYSEVVRKGLADKEYYCWGHGTGRDIWRGLFEDRWGKFISQYGIIVKVAENAPRARNIKVYTWRPEPVYIVRKDDWVAARHILLPMMGWEAYNSYLRSAYVSEAEVIKLRKWTDEHYPSFNERIRGMRRFRNAPRLYSMPDYLGPAWRLLFDVSYHEDVKVYSYGTTEYARYKRQQKREKNKRERARKRPDRSVYDAKLKENNRELARKKRLQKIKNKYNLAG